MTRYICSRCGYSSGSKKSVAGHIQNAHHNQETTSSEDRYGNPTPSYEYRAKIMQYEPDTVPGFWDRIRGLVRRE
jgi:hypothetical protein